MGIRYEIDATMRIFADLAAAETWLRREAPRT